MTEQSKKALDKINALTQLQRDDALENARIRIAGIRPERKIAPTLDDFLNTSHGHYPRWMTVSVSALCTVFLLFAFIPSAQRIHAVALQTNSLIPGVDKDAASIYLAALSTVLMAEIGQVLFSLAAATHERTHIWRIALPSALDIASYICLAIALCGNAVALGNYALSSSIAFLETYAPPVLVLITANILKNQLLNVIHMRHDAKHAFSDALTQWESVYKNALQIWQEAYDNATLHPSWMRMRANVLRDALRKANARSNAVVRELTDDDWRILILREVDADAWYERAEQRASDDAIDALLERTNHAPTPTPKRASGNAGGVRTGETDGNVQENDDGTFTGVCPHCHNSFNRDTHDGAVNALSAHIGRWCKVRNPERGQIIDVRATAMRNALEPHSINGNGNGNHE